MALLQNGTRIYGIANVDTQINVGLYAYGSANSGLLANSTIFAVGNTTSNVIIGYQNFSGTTTSMQVSGTANASVDAVVVNYAPAGSTNASSDFAAYDSNNPNSQNFIDMGISGPSFSQSFWTIGGASDGYLYTGNTNLSIGTAAASFINFFTGGTLAANERLRIGATGNVIFSSNILHNSNVVIANNSLLIVGNSTVNTSINSTAFSVSNSTITNAIVTPIQTLTIALSDEISQITTGTKMTMRAPYAMKLVPPYVRPSLTATGSTTTTIDITSGGTSIFSSTPTLTSGVATNIGPASMSATGLATIADDTQLVFSVSTAGTSATGLKVNLYYVKV